VELGGAFLALWRLVKESTAAETATINALQKTMFPRRYGTDAGSPHLSFSPRAVDTAMPGHANNRTVKDVGEKIGTTENTKAATTATATSFQVISGLSFTRCL
jgi:hypothetical protein